VDLERCKKDAKALVRAFRDGDPEAVGRAEKVLGHRARDRFQLSDAQHVVAVERGHRTWPELRRTAAAQDGQREELMRQEEHLDTGLEYRPGEPVVIRTVRRRHIHVTDDGAAVTKAGKPDGWRELASQIEHELCVNVGRNGAVSLPVVPAGPGVDAIVRRVADASLALYQGILDLEG
jgi:hypothetical protein